MKIITMATLKGGTGKTLNTFNIAGILAENSKVLLIDIDPQCDLTSNCGIDSSNTEVKTIRDIFENLPKIQPAAKEVIMKAPIPELPNLDLIPSSILLFKTEKMLSTRSNKEHILDYFLQNNESYLNQYDYIMIDTNPSLVQSTSMVFMWQTASYYQAIFPRIVFPEQNYSVLYGRIPEKRWPRKKIM